MIPRWFTDAVSQYENPKAVRLYCALLRRAGGSHTTERDIVDMLREGLRYAEIRRKLLPP